ncbi:metal-sensitive transcriptional regulator [Patescibacteria group bacterium]
MRKDIKKRVLRRLNIIEGQIKGLKKMIEEEKYCIDIITQSSAIRQALSVVEDLMLENHLSTHAQEQMKGKQHKKIAEEILKVYKLAKKR